MTKVEIEIKNAYIGYCFEWLNEKEMIYERFDNNRFTTIQFL